MGKYFMQDKASNPWILKAAMAAMGMPDTIAGKALESGPFSVSDSLKSMQQTNTALDMAPSGPLASNIPTLQSDIGNSLAGSFDKATPKSSFLQNFGKQLWSQSPIGQTFNKVSSALSGDFKGAATGSIESSVDDQIKDIFKKYMR